MKIFCEIAQSNQIFSKIELHVDLTKELLNFHFHKHVATLHSRNISNSFLHFFPKNFVKLSFLVYTTWKDFKKSHSALWVEFKKSLVCSKCKCLQVSKSKMNKGSIGELSLEHILLRKVTLTLSRQIS